MGQIQTIKGTQAAKLLGTVDLGTLVKVDLAGLEESVQAGFVGLEQGAFLILRFPRHSKIRENLFENNGIKARFMVRGKIMGLQSKVKGSLIQKNLVLAIIEFPTRLEVYDARQAKRVSIYVPAGLEFSGQTHEGIILDISKGGCLFSFAKAPKDVPGTDAKVVLLCRFLGVHGTKRMECRVKSTRLEQDRVLGGMS